jgi:hypothetical protein
MSSPQMKYYMAHRAEILSKMRERNAIKREQRRTMMEEDPEMYEKEKTRNRTYYHMRCARKNKEYLQDLLKDAKEDFRDKIQDILDQETYKNFTNAELKALRVLATT